MIIISSIMLNKINWNVLVMVYIFKFLEVWTIEIEKWFVFFKGLIKMNRKR